LEQKVTNIILLVHLLHALLGSSFVVWHYKVFFSFHFIHWHLGVDRTYVVKYVLGNPFSPTPCLSHVGRERGIGRGRGGGRGKGEKGKREKEKRGKGGKGGRGYQGQTDHQHHAQIPRRNVCRRGCKLPFAMIPKPIISRYIKHDGEAPSKGKDPTVAGCSCINYKTM
jgi:hypothetical protein